MEGLGCQLLVHDQGIDEPKALMAESTRKCTDDVEAELLPEANRPFIRGNDQVELHGEETHGCGLMLRMLTHGRSNALALSLGRDNVAAVADM